MGDTAKSFAYLSVAAVAIVAMMFGHEVAGAFVAVMGFLFLA